MCFQKILSAFIYDAEILWSGEKIQYVFGVIDQEIIFPIR